MERLSDRELRKRLSGFDAVWARVTAAVPPRETAEKHGVKLMPRKNRCCRGNRR